MNYLKNGSVDASPVELGLQSGEVQLFFKKVAVDLLLAGQIWHTLVHVRSLISLVR